MLFQQGGKAMTTVTEKLTAKEIADRGQEIYYRDILPLIPDGNQNRIVAIDVYTGAYEMADDVRTCTSRLKERVPTAEIFLMRVGYPTFSRIRPIGGRA
jgi:hypothetical protein